MAFAMVTEAVQQSPTIDEPVYVGSAVVYEQQHGLRYNPEHPPLGKLAMAVGLGFEHAVLDPSFNQNQTLLGRRLLYESGNNPYRLMLAARIPMIVLTLLFGLVVFGFARDLAGPWAGLMALVLYAFDPDVLAHGSLATLDVPAAGLLLTTFWMLWRARSRPGLYLPLAGIALGAALATRASALPMVPLVLALSLPAVRRRWWVRVLAAVGVGAIAVAVVWAVYLAVDPSLRWVTPAGVTNPGGLRGLAVDLLPFPQPYRDGVLIQFQFESSSFNGFLLGHAYHGRLWYYLPVALLIKTPLGLLALWAAGAVTMLVRRSLRVAALYTLLPSLVLFLVAMTGARDFGTRYVIFMPMFMTVAATTVLTVRRRAVVGPTGSVVAVPASESTSGADAGAGSSSGAGAGAGSGTGWGRPAVDHLDGAGDERHEVGDDSDHASVEKAGAARSAVEGRSPRVRKMVLLPTLALVLFVAVSSARVFPYFLPYSNEAFGGPAKTHLNLHDANVDWGQDLARLATRLKDRYPGQPVWLVYKGSGVPEYYGIRGRDPLTASNDEVHGLLVVSDSRVALATGQLKVLIDSSTPIDEVGYSITIYRR
ncbi:glycosyltransferase family 39 protein [Actinoplanes sp. NPDC051411]|uniref:ArnT family glycosyltransferase n=1 Tax=Actinoplanes sp. NPDC051411 TaxID=3155522 RepID=UPI00342CB438